MKQSKFPLISRVSLVFFILVFITSTILKAQTTGNAALPKAITLESLLKANSYDLTVTNGKLSGPGLKFLMKASSDTQFFAIGEPHNAKEVPEITSMLFEALHERNGFNYLALEQDPAMAQMVSAKPSVGNRDYVVSLANQYPHAFTFITDQELEMIARIVSFSKGKGSRIWGVDQVFGALHILNKLKDLAPNNEVRSRTLQIIEIVKDFESKRTENGERYLTAEVSRTEDLKNLMRLYHPKKGSETEFLFAQLLASIRIYENYALAVKGQLTGYESNYEREENMKSLFMHGYRQAQAAGDQTPKVLLKLGHTHLIRGRNWLSLLSLGNFISEFAKSNNMNSFQLAMYANNATGYSAWIDKNEDLKPLAQVAPKDKWTVIDFRPLRDYIHAGLIENLRPETKNVIFGFDAALLIGGISPGTYNLMSKNAAQSSTK